MSQDIMMPSRTPSVPTESNGSFEMPDSLVGAACLPYAALLVLTSEASQRAKAGIAGKENCASCDQATQLLKRTAEDKALCTVMCCCSEKATPRPGGKNVQRQGCVRGVVDAANMMSSYLRGYPTIFQAEQRYVKPKGSETYKTHERGDGKKGTRIVDVTILQDPRKSNTPNNLDRGVEMKFPGDFVREDAAAKDIDIFGRKNVTVLSADRITEPGEKDCNCNEERKRQQQQQAQEKAEAQKQSASQTTRAGQAVEETGKSVTLHPPSKEAVGAVGTVTTGALLLMLLDRMLMRVFPVLMIVPNGGMLPGSGQENWA